MLSAGEVSEDFSFSLCTFSAIPVLLGGEGGDISVAM